MPNQFSKNVSSITVALLKHQANNVLGEEAINIAGDMLVDIEGEKFEGKIDAILNTEEGAKKLSDAAVRANLYFKEKCADQDLINTFDFTMEGFPSIHSMLKDTPKTLDQARALKLLRENLETTFPSLRKEQIEYGSTLYLDCLNRALLPLQEFVLPIIGQTVLESRADIKEIKSHVKQILSRLAGDITTDAPPPEIKKKKRKGK